MSGEKPITELLAQLRAGDSAAEAELLERVYPELRKLAQYHLRSERPGITLQATALVNEAYLRIFRGEPVAWRDRAHFIALVTRKMRQILVDHARAIGAEKRGAGWVRLTLDQAAGLARAHGEDLLDLDRALSVLEALDPHAAALVELRFFGGLSEREAAEALGVTRAAVRRTWEFARAWLFRELARSPSA
jgi:RNA polymerase sigma factor (TIGR02999 family)